jgi:uncharacterized protein YkwD
MKRIVVTILLMFMSYVVSGQIIDSKNFDKKLFEKVLFDEVNQFRKSIGIDTVVPSTVLYKKVSDVNVQKMSKYNVLKHFDFNMDTIIPEVANESDKKYGGKVLRNYFGEIPYKSIGEICLVSSIKEFDKKITYKELAQSFVQRWHKSSGHDWIMSYVYESKGLSGLASCAVSMNSNNIYACFNFAELTRTLNTKPYVTY